MADEKTEELFGNIAIERELVTKAQLDYCRGKRNKMVKDGKKMRLGEVMMKERLITKEQALEVLKEVHLRRGDKPRIGGYELIRMLGRGAMGTVYLAKQVSMERLVALKLLPRSLGRDPEFLRRFKREAKTSARLSHKNIVAAIDVGESNGYHYFAMEYVDGGSLESRLKKKSCLDESVVIKIALQCAAGLGHAESQTIVHRDIKPGNIMFTKKGVAKIADMGLAILIGGNSSEQLTGEDMTVGTPYYMSPEQVENREVDFRTDMFSLGATMFEALTGQKPFDAANVAAIMAKRLYEDSPPACKVNREVSRGISAVVLKLMARSPQDRYESFAELEEELKRVAAGEPPHCLEILPLVKGVPVKPRSTGRPKRGASEGRPKGRAKGGTKPKRFIISRTPAIIIGCVVGVIVLASWYILANAEGIKGPRHPRGSQQDAAVWESYQKPPNPSGVAARRLWEEASGMHRAWQNSLEKTDAEKTQVIAAYQKLVDSVPRSAYAAQAQIEMARLGR